MKTRALRRIGWALGATLLAAPLAMACSASGAPSAADGGITSTTDAALSRDAGAIPDLGAVPMSDAGAEGDLTDPGAYASRCLDGVDQNRGDGVDCSDPSCTAAPSCCVGVSSLACCTGPGTTVDLDFACTTGTCATLAGFTTFGDVGPVPTSDGAFAPESDHGTDSGAILDRVLDPRAAMISITAGLAVPATTTEIDAVAVGLVTGGPSAHVVPLAAVVVSAARQEVLLLLGEAVAARAPAPTDGALHDYTLTLDPTGTVTATAGTMTLSATVSLPAAPVRAAFFGRSTNPGSLGGALPARVGSLHVATRGCDQPGALTRLGPITIVDHTTAALLATAADPSLATAGAHTYLAFSAATMGGATSAIFLAERESDGAFHVRAPAGGTQPILLPPSGESYESPALVSDGAGWRLYATHAHDGTRSIITSSTTSADVLTLGAPTAVSIPVLTGDVSSPAPVPGDPSSLVVRHVPLATETTAATPELVLLELGSTGATATPSAGVCGADSSCDGGARMQTHLYAARTATISFDADDVDDPAIVFYDHVYRLYYAGRLGSRWSIGMLIAADLGYWRAANEGAPLLAADGSGFDAVSVRSPAPLVEGGHLGLYYVGQDGDSRTIALAQGADVAP